MQWFCHFIIKNFTYSILLKTTYFNAVKFVSFYFLNFHIVLYAKYDTFLVTNGQINFLIKKKSTSIRTTKFQVFLINQSRLPPMAIIHPRRRDPVIGKGEGVADRSTDQIRWSNQFSTPIGHSRLCWWSLISSRRRRVGSNGDHRTDQKQIPMVIDTII